MSLFGAAGRKVADVRTFLKDAANTSGIKYRAEAGRKHYIYIPATTVVQVDSEGNEQAVKSVIAYQSPVHEWVDMNNRYRSCVCLKGVVVQNDDGTIINDGSCPFCDNVGKAWEIFNYRTKLEEARSSGLTGDKYEEHMKEEKRRFINQLKAREAKDYMYMLIVLYRTDPKNNEPIIGSNGLPEFDLKVMKLSASRIEKINKTVENAGAELAGGELIIEYPDLDDSRTVVSQSTTAPLFEKRQLSVAYPGLIDAINKEVEAFDWSSIDKSFSEWQGMTTAEANNQVKELFEEWDKYNEELKTNPNAVYLEYVGAEQGSNPSLTTTQPATALPQGAGQAGQAGVQGTAPTTPTMGVAGIPLGGLPDANTVFGNMSSPVTMPGEQNQAMQGIGEIKL